MPTKTKAKTKKTKTLKPELVKKPTQEFPDYGYCLFTQDATLPFKWCGDITIPGSPWCTKHESVVYTGIKQTVKV